MGQLFASDGQSIGVSALASVLPMNIQDWFPLGLTGWISFQSKVLSGVFSNNTGQSINSLALSFLYSPILTSIHDHWKNHSFDYMNLCWQSDVFAFEYAKFVIAFVPRNKYLLILWLQSSSEKLKSFFAFFLTMLLAKYSLFLFQLFQ